MGGGSNIVAQGQGMSIIPRQSTGNGNFYLAPTVKIAKVGLSNTVEELVYVDENGDNHYGIENIFKTQLKTFGLDLYYDSSNTRDMYSTMGHWRNSFVSQVDFDINPDDIKDKSNFYSTPRAACESGFADLKDAMHRGILSDATSVYDKSTDMCIIKESGNDIGEFIVWDKENKRDDIHYLTTPNGEFILFKKDKDGKFTTEHNGLMLTMEVNEDGTYSYKDAKDVLRKYDSSGKLIYLMSEGQETLIDYDESGKITQVKGFMDNAMEFSYNEDELLDEISTSEGIKAQFDYNSQKMLSNFQFIANDENSTEINLVTLKFDYNEKNLLVNVELPEKILPKEHEEDQEEIVPKTVSSYTYDNLNRVAMVNNNAFLEKYNYIKNRVTKLLSDGSEVNSDISFLNSQQSVSLMQDSVSTSEFKYDKNGRLSELILQEIEDSNKSSNIQSNSLALKKTLKLQMDYNKKGLISSQYLETSDGIKKFTNFEYKTKYNKPTKVLTNESVNFFDFNNKGQLIKMSYLKFDKDMKLKSHFLEDIKQEEGFQEVSFAYDDNGILIKTIDEVTGKDANFIALKNGNSIQGNIESHRYLGWKARRGKINGVIYKITDADTKLALISGFGGSSLRNGLYDDNTDTASNIEHFYWESISYSRIKKADIFNKVDLKKLIVVGHSYGGDSAVEGTISSKLKKPVDILITIDPVGIQSSLWKVKQKTQHWINLYADAGRQWPGVKVKWRCKRKWGLTFCYPRFYHLKSQWNRWDWIAWTGGKGTWSSYGKYPSADVRKVISAHHNQSCSMLKELKSESWNWRNRRYDFKMNVEGCD